MTISFSKWIAGDCKNCPKFEVENLLQYVLVRNRFQNLQKFYQILKFYQVLRQFDEFFLLLI